VVGMLIVLLISGLVVSSFMLSASNANAVTDYAEHQKALYLSRAGVASVHQNVLNKDLTKVPLTQDQTISYIGTSDGESYMVAITRKSATAANLFVPLSDEDFVAVYEIVSSALVDDSAQTFSAVIDVTAGAAQSLGLNKAIITEGDIFLGSNGIVTGTFDDVHSNGDATVDSNVEIEGDITAVGTVSIPSSDVVIGGSRINGAARIDLPTHRASDYEGRADFKLMSTGAHAGKIYVVATQTYEEPALHDWKWSSNKWTPTSNGRPTEGMYYSDADVYITDNMGSVGNPVALTIVSTKNVVIQNNVFYKPYLEDLAVIADGDLVIEGNASSTFEGIFLSHEQIFLGGNATAVGIVISTGLNNVSELVKTNENRVDSNMTFVGADNLVMPNPSSSPLLNINTLQERKATFDEQSTNFQKFGLNSNGQTVHTVQPVKTVQ